MKDLVLYCKSYRRDFLRLKRLYESIQRFNRDSIPFYISTPEEDRDLLDELFELDRNFIWVSDESIITSNPRVNIEKVRSVPGGQAQANIKSEFWRLGFSENYVCLDSDCIFIKDFYINDFLSDNGTPYTVLYQNKDYFQLSINRGYVRRISELKNEASRVKKIFNRAGPNYYCHCPPFIWSRKVWSALDENFLIPCNQTLWDLVTPQNPETLIYIESLLKYRPIELKPIDQLFKVYYYDWYYYLMRRIGENAKKLSENYLGIIYQSNWESELDYGKSNKGFISRLVKRVKRFTKFIKSYI